MEHVARKFQPNYNFTLIIGKPAILCLTSVLRDKSATLCVETECPI